MSYIHIAPSLLQKKLPVVPERRFSQFPVNFADTPFL